MGSKEFSNLQHVHLGCQAQHMRIGIHWGGVSALCGSYSSCCLLLGSAASRRQSAVDRRVAVPDPRASGLRRELHGDGGDPLGCQAEGFLAGTLEGACWERGLDHTLN